MVLYDVVYFFFPSSEALSRPSTFLLALICCYYRVQVTLYITFYELQNGTYMAKKYWKNRFMSIIFDCLPLPDDQRCMVSVLLATLRHSVLVPLQTLA